MDKKIRHLIGSDNWALRNLINALQGACVTVAALVQYFVMAAYCWMLVEGIYLYLFVVKDHNINNKMTIYHVMSWCKLFAASPG